ncbi:WD40-repeat-containing domain protein [Zopfochytrium polystomum]|nr:WD40-repeat-containing domain protein [Zopfochytrium polystomum]
MEKRKASDEPDAGSAGGFGGGLGGVVAKRVKESDSSSTSSALATRPAGSSALIASVQRTSSLQAPIMLLTGHLAEVFSCKFSPSGKHIASSSFDRNILLWNTYGDCANFGLLKGHTGAVLEIQWSRDGTRIFSASTDKTLGVWDVETGERIKKLKGHGSYVNGCAAPRRGPEVLASVSDDSTVRVWDIRQRQPAHTFRDRFQQTAVAVSDDGGTVFAGGLDNEIKAYDLRNAGAVAYALQGHLDTVTGLRVSPDGGQLLSYAMDNTVRTWDVKPFAAGGTRMLKIFEGAPQGMEKHLLKPCWSADGSMVAAGAADRTVVVWEVATRKILYKLPGHKGCVTEVDWHPTEPIIVSSSNDKTLFLGEVNPTDVKNISRGL